MYAIAPTIDHAMLELQSDFVVVASQKALVGLKCVLNAGKTKYMYSNSRKKKYASLHIYSLHCSPNDRIPTYKYLGSWIEKYFVLKGV